MVDGTDGKNIVEVSDDYIALPSVNITTFFHCVHLCI